MDAKVRADGGLRVRLQPNTEPGTAVIGTLPDGAGVDVIDITDGWARLPLAAGGVDLIAGSIQPTPCGYARAEYLEIDGVLVEPKPFRLVHWPTQYGVITQGFGERPEYYGKFGLPGHEGIDFRAPTGSEVYVCADGTVKAVYPDTGRPYGNNVRITHRDGYETIYAHLQEAKVSVGDVVNAGQLIGLADSTGNAPAAHLHLTLKHAGATAAGATKYPNDIVDPTPLLDPYRPQPATP